MAVLRGAIQCRVARHGSGAAADGAEGSAGAVNRPCALTPLMPKELAPAASVRCSPVKAVHSCMRTILA